MKYLLILILAFSSGQVSAQPGFALYQHVNIHTIFSGTSHLNSAVTYSYYIDELTNLEGLSVLLDHPEIKEIELRRNEVPSELIENGRYLENIIVKNERYVEAEYIGSTAKSKFILKDTFWNCWNLNNFPNLNKVEIYGFVLLDTEKRGVWENSYRLKDLVLHNVSFSSLAELDVESVQFWNCQMPELTNEVPEDIQNIGFYQCDSLTDISYLENYQKLESVTIKRCNNIRQFPHKFGRSLKRMSLQIIPDYANRVISSITSLDHMNFVELNFLSGEAHVDFGGAKLLIDTLIINGSVRKSYNYSLRPKTTIRLENYDNMEVHKLGLHGFIPLDFPDIGKFSKLEILSIVNSCRVYESEDSDRIKSGLESVKGLKSFSANWDTNDLPKDFFLNNPDLEFLYLFDVRFNFYSTDIVPLLKMKKVELVNVMISRKRAKELFPKAEIKII